MTIIRYEHTNTTNHQNDLAEIGTAALTKKVVLFASPRNHPEDRNDTNLPVLSALVEYEIPGVSTAYILFEEVLTAARRAREFEVTHVLDELIKSEKAFFSKERLSFTPELEKSDAYEVMASHKELMALNDESRKKYFSLLSMLPEGLDF